MRRCLTPQRFQGSERGTGADRAAGQRDALAEIAGTRRDDKRGSGIQHHRVAIWAGRALKQCLQCRSVQRGIATTDRLDGRACKSGVLRTDGEPTQAAILPGGHLIFSGDRKLIQSLAVHEPCRLGAEPAECLCHRRGPFGSEHAGELPPHPGRIGQRA